MSNNQSKLKDFYEDFSKVPDIEEEFIANGEDGDDNLIRLYENRRYSFKNRVATCPACNSKEVISHGNYKRIITFLTVGKQDCLVKIYKCKECCKNFTADLTSIITPNSNITYAVKSLIKHYRATQGLSIRQTARKLKEEYGIGISYQTISNVLRKE